MIYGFLFDLDGTLVDTEQHFVTAWKQIAARHDQQYTKQHQRNAMGLRPIKAVKTVLQTWNINHSAEELLKEAEEIYLRLVDISVPVMPGLYQLLDLLHSMQIKMAVVTSSKKTWAYKVLKKVKIDHYFKTVITADDVRNGKPHPEPFIRAANLLGLEPQDCASVEDSVIGVQSAKNAGTTVIAIPNPIHRDDSFGSADIILKSLADIDKKFILSLGGSNTLPPQEVL